ncbi:MAG: tetratricopeptide repeat protein [Deltaproteobacteria bacterium]|nr:tetratricopeptide repeat protein [Deltaproteobacteria bacterium]
MTSRFDFQTEAFYASGLSGKALIKSSVSELDSLAGKFISLHDMNTRPLEKARLLFHWLWRDRPGRYERQGRFRLHHVIKAQVNYQAPSVGNCLGLTLLYHFLLIRIGISPQAIYLENAFEQGPHILTHLEINQTCLDVENIFPNGFDYKAHLNAPSRTIWGDREIVGEIYHSVGNELFEQGDFQGALRNYTTALKMNPRHERLILNREILMARIMEGN